MLSRTFTTTRSKLSSCASCHVNHVIHYVAVVGCYFPRDPRSVSLSAKAHGRVAIVVKALELMLSVVYGLNHTFGLRSRLVSPLPVSVLVLALQWCFK